MPGNAATPTPPKLLKLLLPTREASAAMSISPRNLWAHTAPRGPIRVVRIGARCLYDPRDLAEFIDSRKEGPGVSKQAGTAELLDQPPPARIALSPSPDQPGALRQQLAAVACCLRVDPQVRAVDRNVVWQVARQRSIPHATS